MTAWDGRDADVLDLERAELPAAAGAVVCDLRLQPGDLILLDAETDDQEQALVDVALGLVQPSHGEVRFLGHPWRAVPSTFAAALRGRVGLVPRQGGWLAHASVATNVLLQARYHTMSDADRLAERGAAWSARFGLPGLPLGPATALSAADRLRALLARAFLGDPALVVIETRHDAWRGELLAALVDALQIVREGGGAALWCLGRDELFYDGTLPATARLRVRGRRLVAWGQT
ncbi:MAG: hypothetical protein AAFX81_17570 [Pseudomonadota bacterium]